MDRRGRSQTPALATDVVLRARDPKLFHGPGHAAANALCTRVYRAPFTVPEKV